MKVGRGSRAPRREGKSLQMARLAGKKVLGGKYPVANNNVHLISALPPTCGTQPQELQTQEGRKVNNTLISI